MTDLVLILIATPLIAVACYWYWRLAPGVGESDRTWHRAKQTTEEWDNW